MAAATPLVVLPGLDGTNRLGLTFQRSLPSSIAPLDLEFPTATYLDRQQLAGWVRERLPQGEGIFLLAQSCTTPLALDVARAEPRIRGLILVAPLAYRRPRPGLIGALRWAPRWLLRLPPPRFAVRRLLLGQDAPGALLDTFQAAVRAVSPGVLADRMREWATLLALPRAAVPCPTLCLHAHDDRLLSGPVPVTGSVPVEGVRHVTLAGPHLLLPRYPQAVAEQVVAFCSDILVG